MHPHYCNAPCSNETLKHLWYSVAIFVVHQAVTPASHWKLVVNFLQHWCYTKEHWRLITLWYIGGTFMVHCTALVEHHGTLVLHCVTRLAPIGCPLVPVVRWWQVGLTAPFSAQCPHREVNKGGKTHDTQWTTFENFVAGGNTVVVANGKLTRKIDSDSQQGKKCDAGG